MTSYAHWLSNDQLSIFLLHGVISEHREPVRNYTRKHLAATEFSALLDELGHHGQPLSIDQVLAGCESGQAWPEKAFCISFDDGFENNASIAAPLLEARGIPAVFYMTSGFIADNRMSWIDQIEYCLDQLPSGELSLPWGADKRKWSDPASKIQLLSEIRREVKSSPTFNTEQLVGDIFSQTGLGYCDSGTSELDQKLSWQQVKDLHQHPLFTVGGHSHSHSILSFLSPAELKQEIDLSLKFLSEQAGIQTVHYSYPEGLAHCYSPSVIAALKSAGIRCCPTAILGTNPAACDPFELKRINVVY